MGAPAAADQLPGLSTAHLAHAEGDVQEATCEILDATLRHSRSLGSDHALCDAGLCFCFSCMLQTSTDLCAYGRPRARGRPGASSRVTMGRQGGRAAGRQGGRMTRRLDIGAGTYYCHKKGCDHPCAPRQSLPHVPDGDVGVSPRPPLAAQHTHSHPLGVVERWSWADDCGAGGVVDHGFVGEF